MINSVNKMNKRPPYEIALMHDHILRLEEEINQLKAENESLERQIEAERKDNWSVRGQLGEAECLLCRYDRTLKEIKKICRIGIVDGLTSNLYLCELRRLQKQILEICEVIDD
jgi:SMC interacting uncharacterized protein involved in chromosome segregation